MATNVKRKKKAEVMSDDGSMTLTGHLKELRNRLIICAAVFVVGVIGFLAISDKLIDLLTAMAMNANYTFVFLAPQEKLMQYFRVSLIAAVIVTIPVALYQVYAFAKPGLKRSESFFFRLVLLFGPKIATQAPCRYRKRAARNSAPRLKTTPSIRSMRTIWKRRALLRA